MATSSNNRRRQPGRNKISLTGHLTHDPEIKEPGGGPVKVCTLRIAVNRPIPRDENVEQKADFFRIDVWGSMTSNRRPEAQFENLKKGRQITVDGRMKVDQPRDGEGRITNSYYTVIADEIVWHSERNAPSDVTVEAEGTPDTVKVEQDAPAEAAPAAAPAEPVADPTPY